MANALVSIQILPNAPEGASKYEYVDRAIDIIKASGVPYRVAPLETTMEGELHKLLMIVQQMNEAMTDQGCSSVISQVKILFNPTDGASMGTLLEKYPDGQ
ncbi:thiamine-binding protein [Paenibacillus protaetiae]|uniref:Thiamine-binding protein n=1 Tax=Paenibacillus protaetiae TaxID=2509456 RepID=A0A4P6ERP6_9BACL|nr:thiamine-binding protein [Paenibacillus protaetiae]QAY65554.1 thiamine-binding protein [Paenibacillus protaetiae]